MTVSSDEFFKQWQRVRNAMFFGIVLNTLLILVLFAISADVQRNRQQDLYDSCDDLRTRELRSVEVINDLADREDRADLRAFYRALAVRSKQSAEARDCERLKP